MTTNNTEEQERLNNISKRVNKLLESRVENDKETLMALKELTTYFPENTIQSRRNLRTKIEKKSLCINENFLKEFRKVKEHLDNIEADVNQMCLAVSNMTQQLNATKAQTHQLIEQTTKLQAENEQLTIQEKVTNAFIAKFQLTPQELTVLRDGEVSIEFFAALDKVKEINNNCSTLMLRGQQTIALEIIQQMTLFHENALDRLYRWAQTHCKSLDPATSQLFSTAMSKLQDRPTLFKHVIAAYCTHRRSVLVREFLDSLTKGSKGKAPIEMFAHDPHNYIASMLAFLYETVSSESLTGLFKQCDKIDVAEEMQEALSNISEGVCTPLRVRVEQVASTDDLPLKTLYSITNLVCHYKALLVQILGENGLVRGLKEIEEWCVDKLLLRLGNVVKKEVVERVSVPPSGLIPSQGIETLLSLLRDLLTNQHLQHIDKIVAAVLDPLLQAVNVSASRLDTADMAVYLLNCLHLMQNTVTLYEFMDERVERLQAQCDAQIDTLTSEQASSLVANLNLGPIYTILQHEQGKGVPLSQIPGMQPSSLNNFFVKFERFLASPNLLALPQVECLLSSSHRAQVSKRSTEVIIALYKQLYNCLHNPENGYQNPETLVPHTPDEVAAKLNQRFGSLQHSAEQIV
ncbi:conserved oligomeric Golgi complex subunit 6 [Cimex lectularius]|uniref:Conserved oligomeric Golgi complex subunit 6 n=1 Tax=Cimex lectularius TaxID=79782 RepID=A0A8I6TBM1_CIMLE|nr:conserved oligomeric Golgi complex subunit 6 [Cimex lectularius]XP_014241200.1 conserved oligomeric Golgi complex subunit 6 [Cimex lectularius]XP_014241208.1 conserved oligomeric Golgi complex subunit 6 [Cimex lectularius]XP_014241217.1 conserved oligomeric Golgi complex subunit 6 [Cimex lectularius]